jgi:hypothetical protein
MKKRPKITEYRFDQWADDLADWIQENVSPFEDDTPEKQKERKQRGKWDRLFFLATYLPHYFYGEFEEFHEEWSELADVADEIVPVAAPREHAKSTFFTFGVPVHDIAYERKHFTMIISDSNDQATGFTLPIRAELEENPRIKHDFGELQSPYGRRSTTWTQGDFVTSNNVRVMARGKGEKVRGLKHRQYRPDRVIVDDFENDQNVKNPKLVKDGIDWLLQAVLGSLAGGYSMLMVGNLFAPRSVLSQLIAMIDDETEEKLYPHARVYDCWIDYGKPEQRPLWPALWPEERLEKRRRQMGTVRFNKEMRNMVGAEDSSIKESWILYVPQVEILVRKEWQIAAFLDPSGKSNERNDFKAIVVVGKDKETRLMDVVHAWIRHATINAMWDMVWEIDKEFGCGMGVETNMFEDFLLDSYKAHAEKAGRYVRLIKVHHATEKIARIVNRLQPLIEFGKLRFVKGQSDQDILVEQIIYIDDPNVHDDGPDSTEGAVDQLEGGAFGPVEYETVTPRRFAAGQGAY